MPKLNITSEATFDGLAVTEIVNFAETHGAHIELVKDDGAYLRTTHPDGRDTADIVLYANGHQPPPPSTLTEVSSQDPWMIAREVTEATFGEDDFTMTFTPQQIRDALNPEGLRVRTALTARTIPAEYKDHDAWGRSGPIHHLQSLQIGPPAAEPDTVSATTSSRADTETAPASDGRALGQLR